MLNHLESDYDCARAGDDLHQLKQELADLQGQGADSQEAKERIHRLENQISFILNKCDISPS
ncbi:DUF2524 domain-containing protein [Cohnella sp. REN36]|uniref:DUF2524 domain-containing protein n=1 Tax=Cohnella sp. REN36 TaxID=2887347 RepID=UPI001D14B66C|nr:DUF2524 domain-containing protein [Cohnella sp. REN36]MCC3374712.1 DUF2524 domain-containing protein [Cohnella sp. REN36]